MEERAALTSQHNQRHKVSLRNLNFGRNCKGLMVNSIANETRLLALFVFSFRSMLFRFLVNTSCGEYNLMDRLSMLPAEILATVMSLLPLKEAVATGVLSRRWRNVWKSTVNLDFDPGQTLERFIELEPELQKRIIRSYLDWVDSVVRQCSSRPSSLEKFRVCFNLDSDYASSIDNWVHFAFEKGVQELVLDFTLVDASDGDPYRLPSQLLSPGIVSALKHHIGFKTLKILHLEFVDVTQEVLEHFLSHCPALERLKVCYSDKLDGLRVIGPSIGLKYLVIQRCEPFKSIEICDTNLVSFICVGSRVELILRNVPMLVEVSFSCIACMYDDFMTYAFERLSCCVPRLETLMMDMQAVEYYEDSVFPIFSNLKHLELIVDPHIEWSVYQLGSFLKASPCLQRLVLKFDLVERHSKRKKKAAKCRHNNLKVVELVGYVGASADAHVMYLMNNAVQLERIVVDPVKQWSYHHRGANRRKKQMDEEGKARVYAMRRLKPWVPSSIEFVCL